jgi:hypothetical protein
LSPQIAETPQLTVHVAGRTSEPGEARVPRVDGVQLDKGVHELIAEVRGRGGLRHLRRHPAREDAPVEVLHHAERRADDVKALADVQHARNTHTQRCERQHETRFPNDVVGAGGPWGRGGLRRTIRRSSRSTRNVAFE